ncbi:MAG: ubiquinol-cytochrome C chaperone [Devosia sp.]|uniref:ubiquinol-cytochrome C chaperone family protein n=1 Tax=Devosia sp. TaxID=1871048 RepID=UPI0024CD5679|nr:ubiquinol-cytochrome C chaperone family protein [Devosia sp.]UYN99964.1 MAG: ubiquinol-cytochrome C chaperone [Devosia sp.]
MAAGMCSCQPADLASWQWPGSLICPCLTHKGAERNPMIWSLFRKNSATEPVYAVYNSIVAQSRQPLFYAEWGVPDTVTGRFDMISLHLALLFRRLRKESEESKAFSQAVFDLFFKDMDRSLREMGVTDLGIPKKIQKMGNIFFGMLAAMSEAMDRNDRDALAGVLARNVFDADQQVHAQELAAYLLARDADLAAQNPAGILAGHLNFGIAA